LVGYTFYVALLVILHDFTVTHVYARLHTHCGCCRLVAVVTRLHLPHVPVGCYPVGYGYGCCLHFTPFTRLRYVYVTLLRLRLVRFPVWLVGYVPVVAVGLVYTRLVGCLRLVVYTRLPRLRLVLGLRLFTICYVYLYPLHSHTTLVVAGFPVTRSRFGCYLRFRLVYHGWLWLRSPFTTFGYVWFTHVTFTFGYVVGYARLRLFAGWLDYTFTFTFGCWLLLVTFPLVGYGYTLRYTTFTFGWLLVTRSGPFVRVTRLRYGWVTHRLRTPVLFTHGSHTHTRTLVVGSFTHTLRLLRIWLHTHGYGLRYGWLVGFPVTVPVGWLHVGCLLHTHTFGYRTLRLLHVYVYGWLHFTFYIYVYVCVTRLPFGFIYTPVTVTLRIYTRLPFTLHVYAFQFPVYGWLLRSTVTFTFTHFTVTFAVWLPHVYRLRLVYVYGYVAARLVTRTFVVTTPHVRLVTFTGYTRFTLRYGCHVGLLRLDFTFTLRLRCRILRLLRYVTTRVTHVTVCVGWLVGLHVCGYVHTFTVRYRLRLGCTFTFYVVGSHVWFTRLHGYVCLHAHGYAVGLGYAFAFGWTRLHTVTGYVYVCLRYGCLRLHFTRSTVCGWLRYVTFGSRFTHHTFWRLGCTRLGYVVDYVYVGLVTFCLRTVTFTFTVGWLFTFTVWLRLRLRCVYVCGYVCVYVTTAVGFTLPVYGLRTDFTFTHVGSRLLHLVGWFTGYAHTYVYTPFTVTHVRLHAHTTVYVTHVCGYTHFTFTLGYARCRFTHTHVLRYHTVTTFTCRLRVGLPVTHRGLRFGWLQFTRCYVAGCYVTHGWVTGWIRSSLRFIYGCYVCHVGLHVGLHTFAFGCWLRLRFTRIYILRIYVAVTLRYVTVTRLRIWDLRVYGLRTTFGSRFTFTLVRLRYIYVWFGWLRSCLVRLRCGYATFTFAVTGWILPLRLPHVCTRYIYGLPRYHATFTFTHLVGPLRLPFTLLRLIWLRLDFGYVYGYGCWLPVGWLFGWLHTFVYTFPFVDLRLLHVYTHVCSVYVYVYVYVVWFVALLRLRVYVYGWLRLRLLVTLTLRLVTHVWLRLHGYTVTLRLRWLRSVCTVLRLHTVTVYGLRTHTRYAHVYVAVYGLVGWLRTVHTFTRYTFILRYVTGYGYVHVGCYICYTHAFVTTLQFVHGYVGWFTFGYRLLVTLRLRSTVVHGCWLVGLRSGLFTVATRFTDTFVPHTPHHTVTVVYVGWFPDFAVVTHTTVWFTRLHTPVGCYVYTGSATFTTHVYVTGYRFGYVYVYTVTVGLRFVTRLVTRYAPRLRLRWLRGYTAHGCHGCTVPVVTGFTHLRSPFGLHVVTVATLRLPTHVLRLRLHTHVTVICSVYGYTYTGWFVVTVYVYGYHVPGYGYVYVHRLHVYARWLHTHTHIYTPAVTVTVGCVTVYGCWLLVTTRLRYGYVYVWLPVVAFVYRLRLRFGYVCVYGYGWLFTFWLFTFVWLRLRYLVGYTLILPDTFVTTVGYHTLHVHTFATFPVYSYVTFTVTFTGLHTHTTHRTVTHFTTFGLHRYGLHTRLHTFYGWLVTLRFDSTFTFGYTLISAFGYTGLYTRLRLVTVGYVCVYTVPRSYAFTRWLVGYGCYVWLHVYLVWLLPFPTVPVHGWLRSYALHTFPGYGWTRLPHYRVCCGLHTHHYVHLGYGYARLRSHRTVTHGSRLVGLRTLRYATLRTPRTHVWLVATHLLGYGYAHFAFTFCVLPTRWVTVGSAFSLLRLVWLPRLRWLIAVVGCCLVDLRLRLRFDLHTFTFTVVTFTFTFVTRLISLLRLRYTLVTLRLRFTHLRLFYGRLVTVTLLFTHTRLPRLGYVVTLRLRCWTLRLVWLRFVYVYTRCCCLRLRYAVAVCTFYIRTRLVGLVVRTVVYTLRLLRCYGWFTHTHGYGSRTFGYGSGSTCGWFTRLRLHVGLHTLRLRLHVTFTVWLVTVAGWLRSAGYGSRLQLRLVPVTFGWLLRLRLVVRLRYTRLVGARLRLVTLRLRLRLRFVYAFTTLRLPVGFTLVTHVYIYGWLRFGYTFTVTRILFGLRSHAHLVVAGYVYVYGYRLRLRLRYTRGCCTVAFTVGRCYVCTTRLPRYVVTVGYVGWIAVTFTRYVALVTLVVYGLRWLVVLGFCVYVYVTHARLRLHRTFTVGWLVAHGWLPRCVTTFTRTLDSHLPTTRLVGYGYTRTFAGLRTFAFVLRFPTFGWWFTGSTVCGLRLRLRLRLRFCGYARWLRLLRTLHGWFTDRYTYTHLRFTHIHTLRLRLRLRYGYVGLVRYGYTRLRLILLRLVHVTRTFAVRFATHTVLARFGYLRTVYTHPHIYTPRLHACVALHMPAVTFACTHGYFRLGYTHAHGWLLRSRLPFGYVCGFTVTVGSRLVYVRFTRLRFTRSRTRTQHTFTTRLRGLRLRSHWLPHTHTHRLRVAVPTVAVGLRLRTRFGYHGYGYTFWLVGCYGYTHGLHTHTHTRSRTHVGCTAFYTHGLRLRLHTVTHHTVTVPTHIWLVTVWLRLLRYGCWLFTLHTFTDCGYTRLHTPHTRLRYGYVYRFGSVGYFTFSLVYVTVTTLLLRLVYVYGYVTRLRFTVAVYGYLYGYTHVYTHTVYVCWFTLLFAVYGCVYGLHTFTFTVGWVCRVYGYVYGWLRLRLDVWVTLLLICRFTVTDVYGYVHHAPTFYRLRLPRVPVLRFGWLFTLRLRLVTHTHRFTFTFTFVYVPGYGLLRLRFWFTLVWLVIWLLVTLLFTFALPRFTVTVGLHTFTPHGLVTVTVTTFPAFGYGLRLRLRSTVDLRYPHGLVTVYLYGWLVGFWLDFTVYGCYGLLHGYTRLFTRLRWFGYTRFTVGRLRLYTFTFTAVYVGTYTFTVAVDLVVHGCWLHTHTFTRFTWITHGLRLFTLRTRFTHATLRLRSHVYGWLRTRLRSVTRLQFAFTLHTHVYTHGWFVTLRLHTHGSRLIYRLVGLRCWLVWLGHTHVYTRLLVTFTTPVGYARFTRLHVYGCSFGCYTVTFTFDFCYHTVYVCPRICYARIWLRYGYVVDSLVGFYVDFTFTHHGYVTHFTVYHTTVTLPHTFYTHTLHVYVTLIYVTTRCYAVALRWLRLLIYTTRSRLHPVYARSTLRTRLLVCWFFVLRYGYDSHGVVVPFGWFDSVYVVWLVWTLRLPVTLLYSSPHLVTRFTLRLRSRRYVPTRYYGYLRLLPVDLHGRYGWFGILRLPLRSTRLFRLHVGYTHVYGLHFVHGHVYRIPVYHTTGYTPFGYVYVTIWLFTVDFAHVYGWLLHSRSGCYVRLPVVTRFTLRFGWFVGYVYRLPYHTHRVHTFGCCYVTFVTFTFRLRWLRSAVTVTVVAGYTHVAHGYIYGYVPVVLVPVTFALPLLLILRLRSLRSARLRFVTVGFTFATFTFVRCCLRLLLRCYVWLRSVAVTVYVTLRLLHHVYRHHTHTPRVTVTVTLLFDLVYTRLHVYVTDLRIPRDVHVLIWLICWTVGWLPTARCRTTGLLRLDCTRLPRSRLHATFRLRWLPLHTFDLRSFTVVGLHGYTVVGYVYVVTRLRLIYLDVYVILPRFTLQHTHTHTGSRSVGYGYVTFTVTTFTFTVTFTYTFTRFHGSHTTRSPLLPFYGLHVPGCLVVWLRWFGCYVCCRFGSVCWLHTFGLPLRLRLRWLDVTVGYVYVYGYVWLRLRSTFCWFPLVTLRYGSHTLRLVTFTLRLRRLVTGCYVCYTHTGCLHTVGFPTFTFTGWLPVTTVHITTRLPFIYPTFVADIYVYTPLRLPVVTDVYGSRMRLDTFTGYVPVTFHDHTFTGYVWCDFTVTFGYTFTVAVYGLRLLRTLRGWLRLLRLLLIYDHALRLLILFVVVYVPVYVTVTYVYRFITHLPVDLLRLLHVTRVVDVTLHTTFHVYTFTTLLHVWFTYTHVWAVVDLLVTHTYVYVTFPLIVRYVTLWFVGYIHSRWVGSRFTTFPDLRSPVDGYDLLFDLRWFYFRLLLLRWFCWLRLIYVDCVTLLRYYMIYGWLLVVAFVTLFTHVPDSITVTFTFDSPHGYIYGARLPGYGYGLHLRLLRLHIRCYVLHLVTYTRSRLRIRLRLRFWITRFTTLHGYGLFCYTRLRVAGYRTRLHTCGHTLLICVTRSVVTRTHTQFAVGYTARFTAHVLYVWTHTVYTRLDFVAVTVTVTRTFTVYTRFTHVYRLHVTVGCSLLPRSHTHGYLFTHLRYTVGLRFCYTVGYVVGLHARCCPRLHFTGCSFVLRTFTHFTVYVPFTFYTVTHLPVTVGYHALWMVAGCHAHCDFTAVTVTRLLPVCIFAFWLRLDVTLRVAPHTFTRYGIPVYVVGWLFGLVTFTHTFTHTRYTTFTFTFPVTFGCRYARLHTVTHVTWFTTFGRLRFTHVPGYRLVDSRLRRLRYVYLLRFPVTFVGSTFGYVCWLRVRLRLRLRTRSLHVYGYVWLPFGYVCWFTFTFTHGLHVYVGYTFPVTFTILRLVTVGYHTFALVVGYFTHGYAWTRFTRWFTFAVVCCYVCGFTFTFGCWLHLILYVTFVTLPRSHVVTLRWLLISLPLRCWFDCVYVYVPGYVTLVYVTLPLVTFTRLHVWLPHIYTHVHTRLHTLRLLRSPHHGSVYVPHFTVTLRLRFTVIRLHTFYPRWVAFRWVYRSHHLPTRLVTVTFYRCCSWLDLRVYHTFTRLRLVTILRTRLLRTHTTRLLRYDSRLLPFPVVIYVVTFTVGWTHTFGLLRFTPRLRLRYVRFTFTVTHVTLRCYTRYGYVYILRFTVTDTFTFTLLPVVTTFTLIYGLRYVVTRLRYTVRYVHTGLHVYGCHVPGLRSRSTVVGYVGYVTLLLRYVVTLLPFGLPVGYVYHTLVGLRYGYVILPVRLHTLIRSGCYGLRYDFTLHTPAVTHVDHTVYVWLRLITVAVTLRYVVTFTHTHVYTLHGYVWFGWLHVYTRFTFVYTTFGLFTLPICWRIYVRLIPGYVTFTIWFCYGYVTFDFTLHTRLLVTFTGYTFILRFVTFRLHFTLPHVVTFTLRLHSTFGCVGCCVTTFGLHVTVTLFTLILPPFTLHVAFTFPILFTDAPLRLHTTHTHTFTFPTRLVYGYVTVITTHVHVWLRWIGCALPGWLRVDSHVCLVDLRLVTLVDLRLLRFTLRLPLRWIWFTFVRLFPTRSHTLRWFTLPVYTLLVDSPFGTRFPTVDSLHGSHVRLPLTFTGLRSLVGLVTPVPVDLHVLRLPVYTVCWFTLCLRLRLVDFTHTFTVGYVCSPRYTRSHGYVGYVCCCWFTVTLRYGLVTPFVVVTICWLRLVTLRSFATFVGYR